MGLMEVDLMTNNTSTKLTWPEAYYPERQCNITVEDALKVRDQNGREYRENPCLNSREWYESGYGIRLFPKREYTTQRGTVVRAHFCQYSDQENTYTKIAEEIGINNSDAQYTNTPARIKTMIDYLSTNIAEDNISASQMEIVTVNKLQVNDLNCPDIIIHHKGGFHRRETRIFVIDGYCRKPNYDERDSTVQSIDNWFLNITKYAPNTITTWEAVRPLLMEEWNSFNNRTKSEISAFNDRLDREEAEALVAELIDLDYENFIVEIKLRLSNGDISSQSVFDKTRELYLEAIQSRTEEQEFTTQNPFQIIDEPVSEEDKIRQTIKSRTFGYIQPPINLDSQGLRIILQNLPVNPVILLNMRIAAFSN